MSYVVDKYYPTPLQCRKCFRLGHSTTTCKSKSLCSNCSSPDHVKNDCQNRQNCINCRGAHASTSDQCPRYMNEKDICYVTAEKGVSFSEARKIVENDIRANLSQQQAMPTISSTQTFPKLPTRNVSNKLDHRRNFSSEQDLANSQIGIVQETQDSITTSQQNINQNSEIYDSQDFDFIQPGQQMRPTQPRPTTQYSPLILPSMSPTYQTSSNNASCIENSLNHYGSYNKYPKNSYYQDKNNYQQTNTAEREDQNPSDTGLNIPPLDKIIPKLIPLVISLIFAKTTSDRIELFSKIGQILNLDNVVTAALASIQVC